ncbi:MAG: DUF1295 domain-containing protein [Myxococcales bacterium]|nr:DUF1295 domain-containing protein [Myxococcales bacterium]
MDDATSRARATALLALFYLLALAAAIFVGWLARGEHPIVIAAWGHLAATLTLYGCSVASDNSSVYDAYWSCAPPIILGYWLWAAGDGLGARQGLALAIVCVWATRLTYNWYRQWGGPRHEDWRYLDLREKTGRAYWPTALFALHLFPSALVLLGILALWPAVTTPAPLGQLDVAAAGLGAFAIWIEAVADRQLHDFRAQRPARDVVLDRGVWSWCRNPNYLGELSMWYSLALLGAAADPSRLWVWAGPLAITALFVGASIPLKERRMLARRPAFAAYMRRVPKLLPIGRRRR